MPLISPLHLLARDRFETVPILKKLASASRNLAELKGIAGTIPNQGLLIQTLSLQEAKDSSEIENIVTTQDELFREELDSASPPYAPAKEVLRYREALGVGFNLLRKSGFLSLNHILSIQATLEENQAGLRKLPGTTLKNSQGEIVYTPPQDGQEIQALLSDLERFINEDDLLDVDPLIKMALIHHQFESIHPFYDGNGRSGRILNILYLVKQGLLDVPVLYLSRYIVRTKADYYRLLQSVRTHDTWEEWVLYLLTGVEQTATEGIATIREIKIALQDYKRRIRNQYKFYSQDLLNNLFTRPYTKIEFIERDLKVSRLTATRYLEALTDGGFVEKRKIGRTNYFVNHRLISILKA